VGEVEVAVVDFVDAMRKLPARAAFSVYDMLRGAMRHLALKPRAVFSITEFDVRVLEAEDARAARLFLEAFNYCRKFDGRYCLDKAVKTVCEECGAKALIVVGAWDAVVIFH